MSERQVIVDDLLNFNANEKTIEFLKELSKYQPQKHNDDTRMFNYIHISTLWRRMENGKDVCLEAKIIK